MLRIIWGEWLGRGTRRRGSAARRGHRPAIEGLEQRIALATDVWTGAVSGSWSTAGNWSTGVAPLVGDNLVFPATASNLTNNNDFPGGTTFGSITIQGAGYNFSGNTLSLTTGITTSYTTGTSTDSIDTILSAVVAPITVGKGGTLDISGVLSGAAGVNVTGGGTLDLLAVNKYTGPTTLASGTTLVVDGTIAGVQNSGGLLAGNGTVGGVSSIGGTILPGQPATSTTPVGPGQLTVNGSVTLDGASTFASLLNGNTPGNGVTGYSQLVATVGVVSLNGAKLSLGLGTSYIPAVGDQLVILQNNTGSAINGTFSGLAEGGAISIGSSLLRISYLGTNGSGNSVVLSGVSATSNTTLLPVNISGSGPITLTAQVAGALGAPTGIVEFFNGSPTAGGSVLATASLSPTSGTTSTATATIGSLGTSGASPVLYAVYIPTATSFTYAGSTSSPISFATTTTLSSSSPVAVIGQPVTLTATVTPASAGAGTPTGSVQFIADGTTLLGTVPLNTATGQASLTTSSLAIGTHTIVAQFLANAPFQNSTSSSFSQSISTAGVLPILTFVPVRNRRGKVFRFNLVVTLESSIPVSITPTGTVTYAFNGIIREVTVPISGGRAVLNLPWQRLVNRYVYVQYSGDATFVASASPQTYISHRLLTVLAHRAEATGGRFLGTLHEKHHHGGSR